MKAGLSQVNSFENSEYTNVRGNFENEELVTLNQTI
jgi:hypothetical protein